MASYTPEEIDRGLLALAVQGTAPDAVAALEAAGHNPPPVRTLNHWRHSHAKRYHELATTHRSEIEDIIVQQTRDAALMAGAIEAKMMQRLAEKIDDLDIKDIPAAARNLATSKGINVDKLLTLTGRPNQIHETRNADELLRKLQSLRIGAIEGTATNKQATQPLPDVALSNVRELEQHTSS